MGRPVKAALPFPETANPAFAQDEIIQHFPSHPELATSLIPLILNLLKDRTYSRQKAAYRRRP